MTDKPATGEPELSMTDEELLRQRAARAEEAIRLNSDEIRYSGMDRQAMAQQVIPQWTLAASDLSFSLSNPEFFPNGYSLLEASTEVILRELHEMNRYDVDRLVPDNRDRDKIVRILGQWEKHQPLTPPIMWMLDDKISISDGMHRLSACTFLRTDRIPFYVRREDEGWFLKLPSIKIIERGEWP